MIEPSARGLLEAVVGIAADLSLPEILAKIVAGARDLTGARHARIEVRDAAPVSSGAPEAGPSLTMPVHARGGRFGELRLTGKDGGFTGDDRQAVVTLVAAAGMAIDNATRYGRTRSRQRWLEASHEVTAALLTGEDPHRTLQLIAEHARVVSGGDAAAVAMPREDDPTTLVFEVVAAGEDAPPGLTGLTVPVEGTASGAAFRSREPVVVRNYGTYAAKEQAKVNVEVPEQVTALDSAVAVPLIVGGETLGVLLVARFGDSVAFTDDEVQLARTFAGHAALAMEFARAEEDRQRLAVFTERDRIARDLHDLVIQRLFATGLGLEGLRPLVTQAEVAERLSGFVHELDRTIREIRNSIFSLTAEETGGSLRSEVLRLTQDCTPVLGFAPRLAFSGPVDTAVPAAVRSDVTATVREALSNVARHARAGAVSVEVAVDRSGRSLTLTVSDDGVGIPDSPARRSGLANLGERAARWSGRCSVSRRGDHGTTLVWTAELNGSGGVR
ncbi:GAF domain-containing sensor histidine kinase [Amycolatopsis thermophila]|uniref:Signal transduction histidine kinase n=1 Tax=Amycolatopsis thermophila TaxID=206084 RepID=A0ABU0EVX4_9PSEU|nr:GAF domain-containing sensor histidine kinase [Amycolatopsis thermophila]MDQ0379421.1 signal transduction histidine kinase [Amycolatopsis thermophila]